MEKVALQPARLARVQGQEPMLQRPGHEVVANKAEGPEHESLAPGHVELLGQ